MGDFVPVQKTKIQYGGVTNIGSSGTKFGPSRDFRLSEEPILVPPNLVAFLGLNYVVRTWYVVCYVYVFNVPMTYSPEARGLFLTLHLFLLKNRFVDFLHVFNVFLTI